MARKRAYKGRKKRGGRARKPRPKGGALEVDHLFLGTSDFARAWSFWTDVVGLRGEGKWGDPEYAGSVRAGGASLVLAQGEEGPHDELGYDVENGKPQLYLRCPDVDSLHARLVKRGAKVLRAPLTTHYGARCFSVEGPDGMVVVFTEKR
jgi:predicted enzyme related to lactoylglutathione lyase